MPSTRTFIKNGFKISVPFYTELLAEFGGGCLPHDLEAHAAWDYYTRAAAVWANFESTTDKYEGVAYAEPNLRQLFLSLAKMHDVDPVKMGNYWELMRRQRFMLGFTVSADLPLRFQFTGLQFEENKSH